MKRNHRRQKKSHEPSVQEIDKTMGDMRSASRSQEQMKKDWGSKRTTMERKLAK